ncbi:MAG: hypoxanthine phosphoribosyltransferase [Clostridia bacterium]|jgi:hypoxanthine phosphoribosyltransferase|nr:hypoxanthine phosphoribosyltransferase [Clostridia bacterium]MDH7573644.1 hypoxanthine phosphoribosyltransferase [Clostridia bacterium]
MKVLISTEQLARRVEELARQIEADYRGRELLVVGILKGSVVFLADLIRHLNLPLEVDFMAVASYGSATTSSGVVRVLKDLEGPVLGRHLLLVEDIVDTGLTLRYLRDLLIGRGPATLRTCVLLDKREQRRVEVAVEYCGFVIPSLFVVGYGLDYAEKYRHLPYIAVLDSEVNSREESRP